MGEYPIQFALITPAILYFGVKCDMTCNEPVCYKNLEVCSSKTPSISFACPSQREVSIQNISAIVHNSSPNCNGTGGAGISTLKCEFSLRGPESCRGTNVCTLNVMEFAPKDASCEQNIDKATAELKWNISYVCYGVTSNSSQVTHTQSLGTSNSMQDTSTSSPGPNEAVIVLSVFVAILSTVVVVLVLLILLRYKICQRYGKALLETGETKETGDKGTLLSGTKVNLKHESRKPNTSSKGVNATVTTDSKSVSTITNTDDKKLDSKIPRKAKENDAKYAMNLNETPEMKDNVSQTQKERPCTPSSLRLVETLSIECQTENERESKRQLKQTQNAHNAGKQDEVAVKKNVLPQLKTWAKPNDLKSKLSPETISIQSAPIVMLGNSSNKYSKNTSRRKQSKGTARNVSASAGARKLPSTENHQQDGVTKRRVSKRRKKARIRPDESATTSILSKWETVSGKQKLEYSEETINEPNEEKAVEPLEPLSKTENRLYRVLQSVAKAFFDSERRNEHLLHLMKVDNPKDKKEENKKRRK